MPRWLKFTGLGCGGLLGLFLLVGACAAILAPTEDPDTSANESQEQAAQQQEADPEPQQPEEPAPEPGPAPAAGIGESVTAGDVEWQVTNARQATQLTSEFMEPKQGNFVVVDFAFTNNGTEPVTLDGESLSLIDGEGRTFKTDTETFGYIDPAKDIFLDQVNPGVSQQGEVIFTVAPDASDFTLEAGDTAIFSDEVGRIDLGF